MTALPSIPSPEWNFKDQLHSTCRQSSQKGTYTEVTWYVYDESGKRLRKIIEQNDTGTPCRIKESVYIGSSYEIFRTYNGDQSVNMEMETLLVSSGESRLGLVENRLQGKEESKIPTQLIRYQYSNYQRSVALELDDQANMVSYEEYTPYGITSYQAMHTQTEVPKRYRWTGKDKDRETGLYHNGLRCYMAGIARWTSADPQGLVDGLHLYAYAKGNPISFSDPSGTNSGRRRGPKGVHNLGDIINYQTHGMENATKHNIAKPSRPRQSHGGATHVHVVNWVTGNEGAGRKGSPLKTPMIMILPGDVENRISEDMKPVYADMEAGNIDTAEEMAAISKEIFRRNINK